MAILDAASVSKIPSSTMAIRSALTGEIRPMLDIIMKYDEISLKPIAYDIFRDLIKFCTGHEDVRDMIINITRIAIDNWKLEGPVVEKIITDYYSV